MSSHERESSTMSSRGGGERGGGGGGDGGAPPSSGSATTTVNSGAPSSASTATNISIKPTNSLMGNQQSQWSSSTESDGGSARREYGKDRRPPRSRRSDEEEDDVGDEEDDEEDETEERQGDGSRESLSGGGGGGRGGGRGGGAGRTGSDGSSSAPHASLASSSTSGSDGNSSAPHASLASSSTSGSPVRRLPSVIRPPPPSSSQQQQQQPPSLYENNHSAQQQRQSMPHYYSSMNHAASPRDAALSPHTISSPSAMLDGTSGGRVMAQKRRLQQQQGSEYTAAGSSPTLPPPPPQSQQQLNQAAAVTARSMYEASQHRSSSNSSSSTARSGAGVTGVSLPTHTLHNHSHHAQSGVLDDDDDDDQEDPLRFETRGSHGPRDEARYETWTSKQLRKKCSHLKLRGLKNVKKHVMVEALYRYYRNNQRVKSNATERGSGGGMGGNNSLHLQTRSPGTSGAHDRPMNNNTISARNATSSMRSEDNAVYEERYAQQQHRYEHAMTASNGSSSHYASTANLATLPRGNHATPSLNTSLRIQARRASPSSRPTTRHGSGGGSATYNSVIDLEESKYDALDNEVRITSEDVIRLVDVILSPEFVDRLSSELSRWQFWVDVREKYISLASTNGPSSYGAARGLTALGGDHHTPGVAETGSGDASGRLPLMSSTYMRPSAKWSSMQLWEMWKELTFAYTKTCFEFTAAGMRSVDERNYIQFCDGRPDVFYLHQRLHARPDLLHLIKSNEYIEEKCSSDAASEHAPHMNAEQQNAASALMGVGSPVAQQGGAGRPHKRFKRIVPAGGANVGDRQGAGSGGNGSGAGGAAAGVSGNYGSGIAGGNGGGNVGMAVGAGAASGGNGGGANANTSESDVATVNKKNSSGRPSGSNGSSTNSGNGGSGGRGGGPAQYLASNGMRVDTTNSPNGQQEEGSTENSETTGEEGSLEKTSNSNRTSDSTRRETLADQKYFGLLLQNFEAIFESLHNKKVLLAALRKDNSAPDHLIADLHDDIHVLSALKKDFRNKLRQALE